ncbi:MAG TPA: PaaI family thioesterase [Thermoanaerobaculia bacterium]|jgi:uncharacterized protein (TIGR00369 family)
MATLLERVQRMIRKEEPNAPVADLIGFRVVEAEPGRAIFEMEAGPQHANPMGTLHGGILCDMADAAMGVAYASMLGEGETFTTLELKINFFKPVWKARLRATARIVKRGRTVGMVECDVVDDSGSLVARASSTCLTLSGEKAAGR